MHFFPLLHSPLRYASHTPRFPRFPGDTPFPPELREELLPELRPEELFLEGLREDDLDRDLLDDLDRLLLRRMLELLLLGGLLDLDRDGLLFMRFPPFFFFVPARSA